MQRFSQHDNTGTDYRRANSLRNNASVAEKKLWVVLREQAALKGLKFRRQQAVHPYIADFSCMAARLLIELDGESHDARQGYDHQRDAFLRAQGFSIMRFSNADIFHNVEGVVETILARTENLMTNNRQQSGLNAPLPNPPRKGEGIRAAPATREE